MSTDGYDYLTNEEQLPEAPETVTPNSVNNVQSVIQQNAEILVGVDANKMYLAEYYRKKGWVVHEEVLRFLAEFSMRTGWDIRNLATIKPTSREDGATLLEGDPAYLADNLRADERRQQFEKDNPALAKTDYRTETWVHGDYKCIFEEYPSQRIKRL